MFYILHEFYMVKKTIQSVRSVSFYVSTKTIVIIRNILKEDHILQVEIRYQ